MPYWDTFPIFKASMSETSFQLPTLSPFKMSGRMTPLDLSYIVTMLFGTRH